MTMRGALALGGLGGAALAAGGFSAALLHFSKRWIEPPRVVLDPPHGERFEEVHFASLDGTPLYGWFLDAGTAAPGLVLCHGYQRAIEETFSLGHDLHEHGYNVLLFDFRGCGRSGGRYTSIGYHEPLDARAALAWRRGRLAPGTPLGMLGISMGGSVALTVAAGEPDVRAVVADSAFATLAAAVEERFSGVPRSALPLYRLSLRTAERLCGGRVAAVRPVDAARRLCDRPVLLIHSTDDRIVPYTEALELSAALPGPHELWTLHGISHAMARFRASHEYLARVTAFFDQHLRRASAAVA
jgi:alpha-beta hydrolase superfamily lysophospholipase